MISLLRNPLARLAAVVLGLVCSAAPNHIEPREVLARQSDPLGALPAPPGSNRLAVAVLDGGRAPLVRAGRPGTRAVLESVTIPGRGAFRLRLSLDGGPAVAPVAAGTTGARFVFDQAFELGRDGSGGQLAAAGSSSGTLPALTAVLRLPGVAPAGALGLREFTGFETGDLGEFQKVSGNVSVQSTLVRSGRYALRSQGASGDYSYATVYDAKSSGFGSTSFDLDELHLSFQFLVADWSNRVRFAEVDGTGGATKLRVEIEPDGRVSLEDAGLTRRFSQLALDRDRWYRIDLIVGTGASTKLWLAIDGQVQVDVLDANTSTQLTRRVHVGRAASSGGASDFYYDDLVFSEAALPGDARVVLLAPNGAGSQSQWSGAGSAGLDEWPHDGDASYAWSSGIGALTTALESAAGAGVAGPVHGVKALAVQRRTSGSFTASRLRLRSGGVDHDSSSGDGGSSYALRSRVFAVDPTTGAPWQLAAVEALQVGLLQVEPDPAQVTRVTSLGVQVLYEDAPPPPPTADIGLRQFSGFETGDLSEFRKSVGGTSAQGAVVRSGNYALRAQAVSGQYAYATILDTKAAGFGFKGLGIDELFLGFQFRVADWSSRVRLAEIGGQGGVTKLRVELEPDGVISLKDAASVRRYGATPLALDRWYRVELVVGTGPGARLELLLDGVPEVAVTDADLTDQPTRRVHLGRSSGSGGDSDFFYDDLVISESGLAGDARVVVLTPNGAGSWSQWGGTSAAGLDDWPHDGDLTHAQSSGSGALTVDLASPASLGVDGSVLGVKGLAVQRRTGAELTRSSLRLRSGGTDFDTPSSDGGSAYALRAHLFADDPATGAAWQVSALESLELGLVQNEPDPSLDTRVTALGAAVLFIP